MGVGVKRPRPGTAIAAALSLLITVAVTGSMWDRRKPDPQQPTVACTVADRSSLPSAQRRAIYQRQDGLDWWTGQPLPASGWQVDHVLPWSWALCHGLRPERVREFDQDTANLVATAAQVNRAKSDDVPWEGGWQPAVHACWWLDSARKTIARYDLVTSAADDRQINTALAQCAL